MTTKVSTAASALSLNHGVYKALASLDLSKADAATKYYVQRQLLEFRLAGVDKDDATRKKLNELNTRLADLQSTFERNICRRSAHGGSKAFRAGRSAERFCRQAEARGERQRHHPDR